MKAPSLSIAALIQKTDREATRLRDATDLKPRSRVPSLSALEAYRDGKHDPKRGYASVDRCLAILPITDNELRVLVAVLSYKPSFPSMDQIARNCGLARSTVVSALGKLEALGIINVERRHDPQTGETTSNLYRRNRFNLWDPALQAVLKTAKGKRTFKNTGKMYAAYEAIPNSACRDPRITATHFRMFLYVAYVRGSHPLSIRDLERHVQVRKKSVSRVRDDLIRWGMITVKFTGKRRSSGFVTSHPSKWRILGNVADGVGSQTEATGVPINIGAGSDSACNKQVANNQVKQPLLGTELKFLGEEGERGNTGGKLDRSETSSAPSGVYPRPEGGTVGAAFLNELAYWLKKFVAGNELPEDHTLEHIFRTSISGHGCPYTPGELALWLVPRSNYTEGLKADVRRLYADLYADQSRHVDPSELLLHQVKSIADQREVEVRE